MDNQLLYIISPAELTFPASGLSLPERRARLSNIVGMRGALWASLRTRGAAFLECVERLDAQLQAGQQFVDSAFENSPNRILPIGFVREYSPLFGYYEPESVKKFSRALQAIPASIVEAWESVPDENSVMGQVVYAFRSTFAEAAKRNHAVAVEHS